MNPHNWSFIFFDVVALVTFFVLLSLLFLVGESGKLSLKLMTRCFPSYVFLLGVFFCCCCCYCLLVCWQSRLEDLGLPQCRSQLGHQGSPFFFFLFVVFPSYYEFINKEKRIRCFWSCVY